MDNHPGSENLKPWQPGQSGNPEGKAPGTKNRATILREILALKDKNGITNEYKVDAALFDKALEGDLTAIKEIKDTMHGKIVDKSEQIHTFTQMPVVKLGDGKSLDLGGVGGKIKPSE